MQGLRRKTHAGLLVRRQRRIHLAELEVRVGSPAVHPAACTSLRARELIPHLDASPSPSDRAHRTSGSLPGFHAQLTASVGARAPERLVAPNRADVVCAHGDLTPLARDRHGKMKLSRRAQREVVLPKDVRAHPTPAEQLIGDGNAASPEEAEVDLAVAKIRMRGNGHSQIRVVTLGNRKRCLAVRVPPLAVHRVIGAERAGGVAIRSDA